MEDESSYEEEINSRIAPYIGDALDLFKKYGAYEILKPLGHGSYAIVFLAQKKINSKIVHTPDKQIYQSSTKKSQDGKLYAVKISCIEDVEPSEVLAGLVLSHKNIIHLIEWLQIESYYYFVFEYSYGLDLEVLSQSNVYTEDEFKYIFRQVVDAVDYCHSLKIAHRDIKMENILYSPNKNNSVKLIDFGFCFFAKYPVNNTKLNKNMKMSIMKGEQLVSSFVFHEDHLDNNNRYIYSDDYCAPELLLKTIAHKDQLFPTDIYALGVVLFFNIFRKFPRTPETTQWLIDREDSYPKPETLWGNKENCKKVVDKCTADIDSIVNDFEGTLSQEFKTLIYRMLDPNPFTRFTIETVKLHPWFV